jgi:predicted dinucleotide-binding enzyme
MQIAIIGAGNVGGALARACTNAGHRVKISSSDPADAQALAKETGASAAATNADAADGAEIIVLAVPYDAVSAIVAELADGITGRILIDVTNRFAPDELNGPSNAENIQSRALGAHVVKAFNTVFANNQADPHIDGTQLDGYVAADDATARRTVLDLVGSLGYRPIDVGPLAMARALEGMGTLNISLNMNNNWPWKTGWKLVGPVG